MELRLEAHAALASAPIVEGSRDYSNLTTFVESKANSLSNAAYTMLTYPRYFIWLIPTVGFIGTVVGISSALSLTTELQNADLIQKAIAKSNVSSQIGMAFDTTLVSLVLSSIGFLYLNSIEKKWEFNITNNKDNVLREMVTPQNIIAANQIKPVGLQDEIFTEQLTEPAVKVSRTSLIIFTLLFLFSFIFLLKFMGVNVLDGIANMARSIGLPIL